LSANRRHLQCIKGHYRYRRRWPKNVRAVARGEFFIRHLGTSSLEEALRLRPTAETEFFSEVDRLEGLVDNAPREISQVEATMLVSRWFTEQVRRDAEHDLTNPLGDPNERSQSLEARQYLADFVSDLVGAGELEAFEGHTARLFAEHGIAADRSVARQSG